MKFYEETPKKEFENYFKHCGLYLLEKKFLKKRFKEVEEKKFILRFRLMESSHRSILVWQMTEKRPRNVPRVKTLLIQWLSRSARPT